MIGITSTAKGKGLNKSPKTALSPTFQPPHLPSPIGIPRSSHLSPETNIKIQNQFIYSNLKEYRCKPQNSPVWLVQGAAIYINIAAPCTTEIHIENQHLTLLVKPRVQPRFLHHLLILCFSCNPVIPKNKNPRNISLFRSKSLYLHQFQEQSEAMQRNPHSYQIATGYRTFYSLSLIYQPITKKRLFLLKK
ncbi:hypothetical protein HMPREF1002_00978 [Porphyromonas sp. 31_2]|nr:hypothetical protein HMPREF1002_00978 [Porphyromonas sp. 31_2]